MTDERNTPIRQLRYQLTREDIAAFEFLPRELTGWSKLWLYGPILAFGTAAGLFEPQLRALLPWDVDSKLGQLSTVLIAIAIGYGVSLVLLTARARHHVRKAALPETETVIKVFPQLGFVEQDGNERSYAWSLTSATETPSHLFLTSGTRPPVIIPLRAFDDAADMRTFAAFVRTMGKAAQPDDAGDAADKRETAP